MLRVSGDGTVQEEWGRVVKFLCVTILLMSFHRVHLK